MIFIYIKWFFLLWWFIKKIIYKIITLSNLNSKRAARMISKKRCGQHDRHTGGHISLTGPHREPLVSSGDVVHELVLWYPGTFIDQMRKIFWNPSTWPWKIYRQAIFLDVPEYRNCTGVVTSSINCSTSLYVSIISLSWNLLKPHIKRYSIVENVILGNNKNITFHSCHRNEMSAHVCTMTSIVKETASKQRIQPIATTAAAASEVDVYMTAAALSGLKCLGLNLWWYLFPRYVDLLYDPSVMSLNKPSFLESARASLTTSNIVIASTIHCGSGFREVILSGQGLPERSGGFIPQDGSLPFKSSVRSPKPTSCSDSAHSSFTKITSASSSHRAIGGGGVIPSGNWVPKRSGGLFPLIGLLPSERL